MPDIITVNRLAEILGVDLNYFSESFQTGTPGIAPIEPPVNQPDAFPSGKRKKNLSWDMSRGNWADADFSGLKNLYEKFSSSNMQRCLFIGSDLSGLLLKGNNVDGCDFSGSDISNSHIQGSHLASNLFKECLLNDAEISGSYFNGCDFSGARLTGTEFSESFISACHFSGTDFTGVAIKSGGFSGVRVKSASEGENIMAGAVWDHTSFIDTQLADIVFTGTMEECYFENCAFTRVTFRNAKLLNTFFKNRSLKRIRFIDCQADRITYEFLKNGKADLNGITLLKS